MQGTCLLRLALMGECRSKLDLEKAICNHGFFMMPPNCWIPCTKSFQRPLRLADSTTSVNVSISHPQNQDFLHVLVYDVESLSLEDQQIILKQIARMLRLSDKDERDLRGFHKVHGEAKERGFGRLFRSPSLFEDIVKSILLCNSTWERTLSMGRALCEVEAEVSSSGSAKRVSVSENNVLVGNFPSSKQIVKLKEKFLEERCGLGYRAKYIVQFARKVESGKINLSKLEEAASSKLVYRTLKKNKGFGPFVCANILLCIGFYDKIPIDTETIKHLQKVHSRRSCTRGTVGEIYDKYAPFQCLAYWLELVDSYESKVGKLSQLDKSNYHKVTNFFK